MKVELIDSMGSDLSVVNAARVSFDKESDWKILYNLEEKDQRLIKYLAQHEHWSPFAHTSIQIRVSAPIFVARQLVKHQVGLVWNEISRRYVDSKPEFYFPDEWRSKADNAKQGSGEETVDINPRSAMVDDYHHAIQKCKWTYQQLLSKGVCPEQARMVLPQSMFTSYYVTGSLSAFARAYKLRIDKHAQKEIQVLADQWNTIIKDLYPVSWEALTDVK